MRPDQREKIEEAHGLWELAVVRVAAFVEAGMRSDEQLMLDAIKEERGAFDHWKDVSRKVCES